MANPVVRGFVAGLAGVAAMTAAEKLEQVLSRRPNSYVPARTLERLLGLPRRPDGERLWLNWAMHWGQGIALGPVRVLMAERGLRGPVASFMFLNLRLLNDQTLENATGVGAPPWTWPSDEQDMFAALLERLNAGFDGLANDAAAGGPPLVGGNPDMRDRIVDGQRALDDGLVGDVFRRLDLQEHRAQVLGLVVKFHADVQPHVVPRKWQKEEARRPAGTVPRGLYAAAAAGFRARVTCGGRNPGRGW